MPKEQPEEMVTIPSRLVGRLRHLCEERRLSFQELVEFLLEEWIANDGHDDPFSSDADHGQVMKFFTTTRLFLETMPFETTIKSVENGEIRYLWANSLFRNLARGSDLGNIASKTNAEAWAWNPDRGQKIETWDQEVLKSGKPYVHEDIVYHERSIPRHRLGIRFPLSFSRQNIKLLGSIGIDFDSKEAAETARKTIHVGGDWGANKK